MDGEMDESMRAHFPFSFGKQSIAQHRPSAHLTTRRTLEPAANSSPSAGANTAIKSSWVNEPKKPNPTAENLEEDAIRHLRLPPSVSDRHEVSHDDDGVVIGPPPPPPSSSEMLDVEEEEEDMIGPPRPLQSTLDDGSDSDLDDLPPDDNLRIPLSNEIVLKGHSRVCGSIPLYLEYSY